MHKQKAWIQRPSGLTLRKCEHFQEEKLDLCIECLVGANILNWSKLLSKAAIAKLGKSDVETNQNI
jgi:hypothetical protein